MPDAAIIRTLICLFFAACFLQSSVDKLVDWKGNLEWLTGHFSKTILKGTVPMALAGITVLELAAGVCCAAGALDQWVALPGEWGTWGLHLVLVSLLALFTGQRIAKDYPGAASLATYFAAALLSEFVFLKL